MKRFTTILVIFLTVVLSALTFAQEADVTFYYIPNGDNTNPPLGCPCQNPTPFSDGEYCCVFWDNNHNGWDESDALVQGNFSCFPTSTGEIGGSPGYIYPAQTLVIPALPVAPDTALYCFVISSMGAVDTCCWATRSYLVQPGMQDIAIQFSDWTCVNHACVSNVLPPDHSISERTSLPNRYSLSQNYPNPFNASTEIRFDLMDNTHVELTIYNTQGQKISTLANEVRSAGTYRERWDGKNDNGIAVASGVYLYQIKTGVFVQSKKMVFLR